MFGGGKREVGKGSRVNFPNSRSLLIGETGRFQPYAYTQSDQDDADSAGLIKKDKKKRGLNGERRKNRRKGEKKEEASGGARQRQTCPLGKTSKISGTNVEPNEHGVSRGRKGT